MCANTSVESLVPRFSVDRHLRDLFRDSHGGEDGPSEAPDLLPVDGPEASQVERAQTHGKRHDWIARAGDPDRTITRGSYRRRSDYEASRTDPDAGLMGRKGRGLTIGYHDHVVVDGGKARIVLGALVMPADVMENQPALDLIWQARFRWRLCPTHVTADTTYCVLSELRALSGD